MQLFLVSFEKLGKASYTFKKYFERNNENWNRRGNHAR